jgi:virginiamycin B lyase
MTWRCGLVAALVLCCAASAAQAETPGSVTEYQLPALSQPRSVTNANGTLWLTLRGTNAVARLTTAGGVTSFPLPTANAGAEALTIGPDNNVWFTEQAASRIGRVTPDGVITEFPTPTPNSQPTAITLDLNGNLWFTEGAAPARIARATTAGVITEFPVPGGEALDLHRGPDNNLWYTAPNTNHVGRLDPATQTATEFFAPGNPTSLADADTGSLWYTQQTGAALGRITTTGTTSHVSLPTSSAADAIVLADDGTAWFTEANGLMGNASPAGQVTEFPFPTPSRPTDITQGPDGAIWVPEPSTARIARVGTSESTAAIPPAAAGKTMGAATVTGIVLVKLPGSKNFVVLGDGRALPVGTIVDARKGTVQMTATSGGVAYAAQFFEGQFRIAQRKGNNTPADLKLFGGRFNGCPNGVRAAGKNKSVRHLWGDGGGKFRTVGRFSSASVRGTKWLTDDQCAGTLTRVTAGSVSVRDFVRRRTVVVRAGKRYFAAARGR